MKPIWKFMIAIAIPLTIGAISGWFTSGSVNSWFNTINKPLFNPPNWVFAPVWTTLYILMGIASFLVWRNTANAEIKRTAIVFYTLQLILNFLWSFIFFGSHQIGWALIAIILLWGMILITILWFGKISAAAGWLLVPYICWVSFAVVLNYSLWRLNVIS